MHLDAKFLSDLKQRLERDKNDQFALYNQTMGALFAIEHIEKNGADALSIADLERAVGGTVEAIEPVGGHGENGN